MIFRSFAGKIWIVIISWVFLVLLIFGGILAKATHDFYYGYADEENEELTNTAQGLASYLSSLPDVRSAEDHFTFLGNILKYDLLATDINGNIVLSTHQARDWHNVVMPSQDMLKLRSKNNISFEGSTPYVPQRVLKVAAPIIKEQQFSGAVFVIEPLTYLKAVSISVNRSISWGLTLSFLLAVPFGLIFAKRVAHPVVEMDRAIKDIATGNYSRLLTTNSTAEFTSLGQSVNTLSEEIREKIDEIERERQQLANILASIDDGVLTLSPVRQIVLANRVALHLFADKAPSSITVEDLPEELRNFLLTSFAEPIPHQGEFRFKDQVYSVETSPLVTSQDCGGLVAVWHDVTKERQLEDLRREFVANVSHELRTPLSYLQGYSEALLDGIITEESQQRHYLATIHSETLRMRRLVNDLLELNRIEYGGALELPHEEVAVLQVLQQLEQQISPPAKQNRVNVRFEVAADLPPVACGTDRLKQILLNLLDNALRFSPEEGEIRVCALALEDFVEISVSDQGPGIAPEDQLLVWNRFERGRQDQSDSTGSGLGLAIVKGLVLAYGGQVTLTSQLGQGSTFAVRLPLFHREQ